ncbi:GNAT family N-acetyltransferase [Aliikangiella sp. G2MR2-5]|uniref:GNAT family N-acetyltransferase n=1 Tax=Aliikangiella sp. G2MR2-5 TaxID=2788943 RepID=UPI0018ABFF99|nr:GNAT family N-acetyltransferase [Aliikangiella sp. G2MR2-5]
MNNLILRRAEPSDMPVLLQFEQGIIAAERPFDPTLKNGHINYYDIGEMIVSDTAEVLVVTAEDNIVASGYAKIKQSKDYVEHESHAFLGFMFVLPEFRGKRVNQMIIDGLTQWAKSRDISEIRLEVYAENEAAIRAYKKAGFYEHIVRMRAKID